MPALFESTSNLPNFVAASTSFLQSSLKETSQGWKFNWPSELEQIELISSPAVSSISAQITMAPASVNPLQIPAPIPLAPPNAKKANAPAPNNPKLKPVFMLTNTNEYRLN